MNNNWFEKFSGFLLDLAKIVFTALIIGKIVSSEIDWSMFWGGTILLVILILISSMVSRFTKETKS